ncbi:hypothetical protein [Brachyspira pilosicoli]|nr:hypothetical protein [Brachyspira pilosicoli]
MVLLQEIGKRKDKVSGIKNYVVSVNKDGQGDYSRSNKWEQEKKLIEKKD